MSLTYYYTLLCFIPRPSSLLFPYTTLFRSTGTGDRCAVGVHQHHQRVPPCQRVPEGHRLPNPGTWAAPARGFATQRQDRKSTRLNSSHVAISYAVFCLKKKTNT